MRFYLGLSISILMVFASCKNSSSSNDTNGSSNPSSSPSDSTAQTPQLSEANSRSNIGGFGEGTEEDPLFFLFGNQLPNQVELTLSGSEISEEIVLNSSCDSTTPSWVTLTGLRVSAQPPANAYDNMYRFSCDFWFNDNVDVKATLHFKVAVVKPRGYTARACGFDMNRNGIIGEPADCRVCDGSTSDPDGDGVNEDIIYIDSATGTDNGSCGAPGSPCNSINYAVNPANGIADGDTNSIEDIFCIAGTFNEAVDFELSGLSTEPAGYALGLSGSIVPRQPTMIVGWDKDADGEYPPFDTDDIAVLDGLDDNARNFAISNDTTVSNYFEIAHITVQNYENSTTPDVNGSGLLKLSGGSSQTHIYLHDVSAANINDGNNGTGMALDALFPLGNTTVNYLTIDNFACDSCATITGGYGEDVLLKNFVMRHTDIKMKLVDNNASFSGIFNLGNSEDVLMEKNIWDGNLSAWTPVAVPAGITMTDCNQDWTIRENNLFDVSTAVIVSTHDGCTIPKTNDDILIEGNHIKSSAASTTAFYFASRKAQDAPNENTVDITTEDVTIINNLIEVTSGHMTAATVSLGNSSAEQPGVIIFSGNTIVINGGTSARGFEVKDSTDTFKQQEFVVENNIFEAVGGDYNYYLEYNPTSLQSDGNVFHGSTDYYANSGTQTFAQFKTISDSNATSKECVPSYADKAASDFLLDDADTCAVGAGRDISSYLTRDYRGDRRSTSAPNAGAFSQ